MDLSNSPFATIQAGINASEDNDTIFVAAGHTQKTSISTEKLFILKGLRQQQRFLMVERRECRVQVVGGEGSGTTIDILLCKMDWRPMVEVY